MNLFKEKKVSNLQISRSRSNRGPEEEEELTQKNPKIQADLGARLLLYHNLHPKHMKNQTRRRRPRLLLSGNFAVSRKKVIREIGRAHV